jgi:diacylglycerol O-acyltransferase / wax synthase
MPVSDESAAVAAAPAPSNAAPHSQRMSRVDTAWLRMDNEVNLMMIVGVWLLKPGVTAAAARERVSDKLLQYGRFRQRVVEDATGSRWVDDPAFDLDHHLVVERLAPAPGQSERTALQQLVGRLATTTLDRRRPLWQFHLIEQYDGGSALIARIHHCIADGIALISVMLSITDGGRDPPVPAARAEPGAEADGGEADWLTDAVVKPLTDLTVKAIGIYGKGVSRSIDALAHPQTPLLGSVEMARSAAQVLQDVAALALMPDDSPTALKGDPIGRKRVAWGEPIPLEQVKTIGKAIGCSINDVLLACAAGAIGRYLRERGDDPHGKEIRAMVPVNLRPLEKAWQLGNRFGLVPLVLPIGIDNPLQRVFAVRSRMAELKGSYQPLLAFAVLSVAGLLIKPAQDALLDLFARKATAVMTNVPGPREPLRFCGSTLEQTMFWVPQSGHIGMGVSILSYGGGVQFGLITDEKLCPDPQAIIDRFEPEFEQLLYLTLMLPWGEHQWPAER